MADNVKVTQADYIEAADAAIFSAQQALGALKGKVASIPGADSPAAAYDAQSTAQDVKVAVAEINEALRQLVVEAQADWAAYTEPTIVV
jgi:hypothetical protein